MAAIEAGPAAGRDVYAALTAHTTDLVAIVEADGTIRYASPSFERILGYAPAELQGTSAFAHVHPDDVARVQAAFAAAVQADDGTPLQVQCRYRHADGSWRMLETTGSSHLDDPLVRGYIAISQDVTVRVQAEEQLGEKEAQYRSIFEATGDGLVITDLDGTVIEANPAYCAMYGRTYDEAIGQHAELRTVVGGGTYQSQAINQRKDGTPFHVEGHATTFTYNGKPHLLGVVRDITARVQAEEHVREQEEQYRSIFESSLDGLIISDRDGFLVEVNPAACQMYGYTHEELVSRNDTDLIHPDYLHLIADFNQAIEAGGSFQS